ncbi:MAG: ATP-binding protein, partial [Erysipelotrichaceae bacterium]|nr:ATP-binding protein [Erysipelotrichaceae bacterium]
MLIQFNFKNFKSFKDDTVLDLSATKITEFNNHVINIGEEKILPIAAIFGANASGKSNVHQAFRYMCNYVINSFGFGGDNQDKNNAFIPPTPFLFDNTSKNDSSSFEVYFITDENDKYKTYNYGFCVDKQGVKEEWLNSKAKTAKKYKNIFYRNREEDELILDGISSKNHENIRIALENEALVVSLGAKLKIQCLKKIRDWFLKHEVADFGNPLENFLLSRFIPEGFDEDEEVRKNVINYFSSFDESIVDFKVEKITDGEGKEH